MSTVTNLDISEFYNIINEDVLVICINYTNEEFNAIRRKNYVLYSVLNFRLLKKYHKIIFSIKFTDENTRQTTKIIRKIKRGFLICKLFGKKVGIISNNQLVIANIEGIPNNNNLYLSVVSALKAMTIKVRKDRLKYIYKEACKYLDREVVDTNVCGFSNNKCSVKKNTTCTMGCCHHYPHKRTGIFRNEKLQLCEYQVDGKCVANCVTCKMYMCPEMERKGYRYNVFNVPLINCFFNIIQKIIMSFMFFTKEEEIFKLIIKF